jgi:TonB family protein
MQQIERCVMNLEVRGVPDDSVGLLKSCLVDGDPELQLRAQTVRRRAILLSIVLQTVAVAALVIFPLLGKGERIPVRIFIERPPFRLGSAHPNPGTSTPIEQHSARPCLFCKSLDKPGKPTTSNIHDVNLTPDEPPGIGNQQFGTPDGVLNGLEPPEHTSKPPANENTHPQDTRRITIGHIDPAYLVRRIEPRYPPLCVQLRRETRVELRAIIGTDGSIQSLQALSGDPLFYQSALDAVREWHYHPTILNGRAVEVDTHITVIYSLNR